MPALTISAVNTGTDTLTSVAHGKTTGDGPCNAFNAGGALPAPLAALTSYWIIRVDADNLKLATSQANAIAGTAIDITTAGSGATQLLFGLPTLRNTTCTAGSQVKSADLNDLQDCIVNGKHGPITIPIHGSSFQNMTGGVNGWAIDTGGFNSTAGTAMSVCSGPLKIIAGTRITGCRFYVKDSATGPTTLLGRLITVNHAGTPNPVNTPVSAGTGADQTLAVGSLPILMPASQAIALFCIGTGTGACKLYMAEIDIDRL